MGDPIVDESAGLDEPEVEFPRVGMEEFEGPVAQLRVEDARFTRIGDEWLESPRQPVLDATFDELGRFVARAIWEYEPSGPIKGMAFYTFDGRGRLVETRWVNADGSERYHSVNTYDEQGRLAEAVTVRPEGEVRWRRTCVYDEAGRPTEVAVSYQGVLRRRTEQRWTARGREVERTSYRADGAVATRSHLSYDAGGRLLEVTALNSAGGIRSTLEHAYGPDGLLVEIVERDAAGALVRRATYAHDAGGRLLDEAWHDPEGCITGRHTHRYDADGHEREWRTYGPGDVLETLVAFLYDPAGRILERVERDSAGAPDERITYERDAIGNWVRMTHWEGVAGGPCQ